MILGILAHVDAGKTTLSEALLYETGKIRTLGRVDHQDAYLDTDTQERERGITIFSKQALFELTDMQVTLLDTPGHTDFRADAERAFSILDAAVFIISAAVPVFIYINKVDQQKYADETKEDFRKRFIAPLLKEIEQKLLLHGETVFPAADEEPDYDTIAACDESAMEEYFETGELSKDTISALIENRRILPVYYGSALKMTGVDELIAGIKSLGDSDISGNKTLSEEDDFGAVCYKVSKDDKGSRLTFVKVTSGRIAVREEVGEEKINQIRLYSGGTFKLLDMAEIGDVVAFTGISNISVGEGLGIDLMVTGNGKADIGIIVNRKCLIRKVDVAAELTVSKGGITPGHIHVQRRTDIAHHRKGAATQAFQGIRVIISADCELCTKHRIICASAVYQTFVGRLGQSAP